ncbi:MAG: DUF4412 domain-containing protein [Flavobacteriales bacterium]|nr:DUF4412 domain-containing protein [Flavobacteriales bacterium]
MKASKVLSTLMLILGGVSFAFAQSSFEGVITYNTTNASIDENATVKWYHANGNNLMEFDSRAGDQSYKYAMIMGSNDESVFMKSDIGSQEVSGITGEEVFTSGKFIRKMNVKEAGYDCEMLMFKSNGNDLTYWVTDGIGMTYSDLPKLMRNNMPSLAGISTGIPIKMELRDASGNLLRSQSLVSVEERSIDKSKFAK